MIRFLNLPSTVLRITSPFGYRWHPIHNTKRLHNGVDIGAFVPGATNDPVRVVQDGRILRNEWNNALGWFVVVSHRDTNGNEFRTWYQHLAQRSALRVGQEIKAGTFIAMMGSTGDSTAIHLHFGLQDSRLQWANPLDFLVDARDLQALSNRVQERFNFDDNTMNHLRRWTWAIPLLEQMLSPSTLRLQLNTINYILEYRFGREIFQRLWDRR